MLENAISTNTSHLIDFASRLNYVIDHKGISKSWLAKKLNISKQALNYLLKSSNKPKYIDEISELLSISPDWLEHGTGEIYVPIDKVDKKRSIPVLKSREVYGYLNTNEFKSNFNITVEEDEFSYIGYLIENDSLFPPFIEGSILIFKQSNIFNNGDFVLIIDEPSQNSMVRKAVQDGNSIFLKPCNESYDSFKYNEDSYKIVGILQEARYTIY